MTVLVNRSICLAAGFLLDMILGDPYSLPHPVRWIGRLIAFLEGILRKETDSPGRKRRGGCLLAVLVLLVCGGVTAMALGVLYHVHRGAGVLAESILCYQMLSMKCLKTESRKVYRALREGDVEQARSAVSMIVGRDTARLDETGIIRAAVETVAENTSDGVIAPMFYFALGGGVLGLLYKAVNTMDSMIGYRNDKYLDFGRCAAKLDDFMNYVPSRLAALLMIAGAGLCRLGWRAGNPRKANIPYDPAGAWRVYRRDRYKHASPNSAQTESACAGALGVRLAGDAWYGGVRVAKPYIGDARRPIEAEDIRRADCLLYASSFLMWAACMGAFALGLLWCPLA